MANEFKIKKGLIVTGASGGTVVDIQGSQGQLFSVTDDLSGSIFAVSDISGVPILDVNSSGLSTFDGNVNLPDNNKLLLGTGNDLEIYHTGSHSFINGSSGAGSLYIRPGSGGTIQLETTAGSDMITAGAGTVVLYSGGVAKLATTSAGVSVTGDINQGALYYQDTAAGRIGFNRNTTNGVIHDANYNAFQFNGATVSGVNGKFEIQSYNQSGVFGGSITISKTSDLTTSSQVFSAATSSGDASSTLTTKGYVDGLITGATIYRGAWDPSGGGYGSPDLSGVTQTSGYYYICSAAGTAEPNGTGTEPDTWAVGDWVIYNDVSGTGQWQKIDNSSVLSGVGTGQTVALWEGAGSVTDSETLGNAPITVSGNDTTFGGNITTSGTNATVFADRFSGLGVGAVIGPNGAGTVFLRPSGVGSSTNQSSFTTTLATIGTDATFAGDVVINSAGDATSPILRLNNSSSNTFNHALEAINDNLTAAQTELLLFGKETNNRNSGFIGYNWNADNSETNYVTIGHWGYNHLLKIYPTGTATFVGAVTSPTFLGDLNGTINTATTGVTQTAGDNSTLIATTAYADAAAAAVPIGNYLPLAGGTMTGNVIFPGEEANSFKIAFTGASASSGLSTVDQSGAGLYIGANSRVNTSGNIVFHDTLLPSSGIYFDGWSGDDMEFYTGLTGNPTKRLTINSDGNAIFTGNVGINQTVNPTNYTLEVNGAVEGDSFSVEGSPARIFAPSGAKYNGSGTQTGYLIVKLPDNGASGINNMMTGVIRVFDYTHNESFDVHFAGYWYSGYNWTNCSAWIESSANDDRNFTVRFGEMTGSAGANTRPYITIGEATSTWTYCKFSVINYEAGHSNYEAYKWNKGWSMDISATNPGNVLVTKSNAQVNNWARNGQDVYYGSGTGNVGIGTTSPSDKLDVTDGNSKMVFGGASSDRPLLYFQHNAVPVNAEEVGLLDFRGYNDASQDTRYVILTAKAEDVTDGSEDGSLTFQTMKDGTATQSMTLRSGNVGIGTTNPGSKLDIDNGAVTDVRIRGNQTSDARIGAYNFYNTAASDVVAAISADRDGANDAAALAFDTQIAGGGMTERMRITSTGNVGIGAIPRTISTYKVLDISGSGGAGGYIGLSSGSTQQGELYSHSGGVDLVTLGAKNTRFYNNGSERMRITSAGRVGIGTTNPGAKLELSEVSGAAPTLLTLHQNAVDIVADDTMGSFIDFKSTDINANFTPQARIGMLIRDSNGDNGVISEGCGNLVFHTSRGTDAAGAGEDVERMRITDIGNVGIGTSTPNAKLDVQGTQGQLFSVTDDLSGDIFSVADISGVPIMNVNSDGTSYFDGNVGIGTTSPGDKLHVNGTVRSQAPATSDWGLLSFNSSGTSSSGVWFDNGSAQLYLRRSDNSVQTKIVSAGSSYINGGNVGINVTNPNARLNVNGGIKIEGTNPLSFGGSASVPSWAINSSGSDLIINDQASTSGSVLFNNNEGVALPRLTTTQINVIPSPTQGLMAYNTTLNTICFYNGSSWQKVSHTNM